MTYRNFLEEAVDVLDDEADERTPAETPHAVARLSGGERMSGPLATGLTDDLLAFPDDHLRRDGPVAVLTDLARPARFVDA